MIGSFAVCLFVACLAQSVSAQGSRRLEPAPNLGEIRGRLVDSATGRPVSTGSVAVRRVGDSVFVSGAFPEADGTFRVDGLRPGRYTLRVRAIGFAPFLRPEVTILPEQLVVDLGSLALRVVAVQLEAAQTVVEREAVVLAPDRTSYATKDMSVASGGTVIDVLRTLPLVEVDGSNTVSLRGSANVVIQVNGRTTPLKGEQLGAWLAQLPAATVKNIEVATNPSAKDDPEGTAGIINIVLEQEAQLGFGGGINGGTSSTGVFSAGGNVGKQQGKLTVFASANVYRNHYDLSGITSRTNLVIPVPAFVEMDLGGDESPVSAGGALRSAYRFTERSTLSFDSYFNGSHSSFDRFLNYADLDAGRTVIGLFHQANSERSRDVSQDYDLAFRHFADKNRPLFSTELEYSDTHSTSEVDLSGTVVRSDPSTPPAIPTERDHTTGRVPYLNWKTDYAAQFGVNTKLELGLKGTHRTTTNDFDAAYFNQATATYLADPRRAMGFEYHEDIGAGYALLSSRFGRLQTQTGLRLEDAATYLDLTTVDQRYDRRYASVYPSGIISYALTPARSVRISYSRRVSRPNPFQLSPIELRQDTRNVFRGNPALRAEYTNAIELGYQEARPWGSVQLTPYLRSTRHAVRLLQFIDSSGVHVGTFDNVASTRTIGTDLNINAHYGPVQLGASGSVYHYASDASNLAGNPSTHAMVWSARTNATWKFSAKTDAQFLTAYRAPYATEGGSQIASVAMNLAGRYKLWGDQGSISVRLSDPFKLQRFGFRTANGTVVEYSERFFGTRAIFVTVTRNFGQAIKLQPKPQDSDAQAQPGRPPG